MFSGGFAFVEGDTAGANHHLQYRMNVEHRCTYVMVFSYFLYGSDVGRLAVKAAPPMPLGASEDTAFNFTTLFMADKAGSIF